MSIQLALVKLSGSQNKAKRQEYGRMVCREDGQYMEMGEGGRASAQYVCRVCVCEDTKDKFNLKKN